MALLLAISRARSQKAEPQTPPELPEETPVAPFEYSDQDLAPHPKMRGRMPPDLPLLSLLDKYLYKDRNSKQTRSRGVFHPSELDGCKRYLALDYIKVPMNPQAHDARIHRIFENGSGVHERIQKYLRQLCDDAGMDAWFRDELPISHPDLELDGSTDGVLYFKGYYYAIEIKSINNDGFSKLRKPDPKHVKQINRYMGALGIWKGIIIYENKNNQDWKEFVVTFNHALWGETVQIIDHVKSHVLNGTLPPQELSASCKSCKFKKLCIDQALSDEDFFAQRGV